MKYSLGVLTGTLGLLLLLSVVMVVGRADAAAAEPVDSYGGWTQFRLEPTGRFRIEQWRGGRWIVTPEGHPMVLAALAHPQMPAARLRVAGDTTATRFGDDPRRYGKDLVTWMRGAGLNTYSYGLPETVEREMNRFGELMLIPGFIPGPQFPDLFDSGFRAAAAAKIANTVPALAADARVVGYILSAPLLFSPIMERPRIWRDGAVKRQNYLMAVKALPAEAAGRRRMWSICGAPMETTPPMCSGVAGGRGRSVLRTC